MKVLTIVIASLSRISHKEMELGREDPEHSVAVADGQGGYMGSLGVFHELHCLVSVLQCERRKDTKRC